MSFINIIFAYSWSYIILSWSRICYSIHSVSFLRPKAIIYSFNMMDILHPCWSFHLMQKCYFSVLPRTWCLLWCCSTFSHYIMQLILHYCWKWYYFWVLSPCCSKVHLPYCEYIDRFYYRNLIVKSISLILLLSSKLESKTTSDLKVYLRYL